MKVSQKIKVAMVEPPGQFGYVPIANGYLAAYATQDPAIRNAFSFKLNTRHFHEPLEMVLRELLAGGTPDIVAFSCQGWSVRRADLLAAKLREINPAITVIYGGNHVSHQGEGFFQSRAFADVLVNGEGEATFYELLRTYLDRCARPDFARVRGVSVRTVDGSVLTTPPRERIKDLSTIPSPYLSGVLDVTPANCRTALLETNRGCPYSCSYCYWGGAIGQKIYIFPLDRLREEMLWLARREIDSWYICDANFGILPQDQELLEYAVWLHREFGFPKTFNTNWAKNSNERIVKMCARLNKAGIHSAYSLSLQSTTPEALRLANRANMRINRIEEIATLCREHDVVPRGELIWGLPGESYEQFLHSYDDLSEYTDSLHVYPHYLLPNTGYIRKKDEYKIVMEQGELDTDYFYCVEHMDMTRADFMKGLRFVVSNNILKIGSVFFRLYPRVAHHVAGIRFAHTIEAFGDWVVDSAHPMAGRFKKFYRFPLATHRLSLGATWQALRDDHGALVDMFESYIEETFIAGRDAGTASVLRGAFAFDAASYPVMDSEAEEETAPDAHYLREEDFEFDFLSFKRGGRWDSTPRPCRYTFSLPKGLWRYPTDNWYIGLLSFQAKVEPSDKHALV